MSCYITANGPVGGSTSRADVDGGPTQLESPDMDFSAGDGLISYKCWAFNDNADLNDGLVVEVSNDGGTSWTMVENMTQKAGGWLERYFRLSDYVVPSANVRVRFSIADNPDNSDTEGGVDTFRAELLNCPSANTVLRIGSGVNTTCFTQLTPPVIGTSWVTRVNHVGHPGAVFTAILLYSQGTTGPIIGAGELLVNLGSQKLLQSLVVSSGTIDVHSIPIPPDATLAGAFAATQAAILGGGLELCNALDVTVGF